MVVDFEAAILRIHPNARVYTFELDPTHIPSPSVRNPRVDWNNIGLGYDRSPNSIFKTFREIMISKGHSYIDILKIDIDGGEWNWIFQEGDLLQRIGQMLIEIHVVGLPKLIFPNKTVANLIDEIEKYDMRMFFKEINHAYPFCCTEMSFVQKDWDSWNLKKQNFQALTAEVSSLSAPVGLSDASIERSNLKSSSIDSKEASFLLRIAEKYYTRQKSERMRITTDFQNFNPNFPCIW